MGKHEKIIRKTKNQSMPNWIDIYDGLNFSVLSKVHKPHLTSHNLLLVNSHLILNEDYQSHYSSKVLFPEENTLWERNMKGITLDTCFISHHMHFKAHFEFESHSNTLILLIDFA